MKNGGGHFAPELGGHFELESGAHFKLELGGQYHWNLHTTENIEKANRLFTTINTSFLCNTIVVRKFDPTIQQFFITDTFTFNSNQKPELIQGRLF